MANNPPIKEYQLGRIKIAKWQGEFGGKPTFSFSITKNYKDQSGEWKTSSYFTLPDLRDVALLAMRIVFGGVKEYAKGAATQPAETAAPAAITPEPVVEQELPDNIPDPEDDLPF